MKIKSSKGMFSIDASLAVVILLFMSLIVYFLIQSLNSSFAYLNSRQKEVYLLVMSDEIVRKEAAVKTNTEVISNKISLDLLDSYFDYLKSKNSSYGFRYIEIKLFSEDNQMVFSRNISYKSVSNISGTSQQFYCIQRPILYQNSQSDYSISIPAVLKVCAQ
jgi:uncharacterized protein (UPF0333 family)